MKRNMRILVAYDGSPFADNAIDELIRAGLPAASEALIAYVQETWLPPPAVLQSGEKILVTAESAAARPVRVEPGPEAGEDDVLLLSRAEKKLRSVFPGWSVETNFSQGSPASRIVTKAREWNADLVVLGSHGTTGNRQFALGSVSQKIANEADTSVRIVRGEPHERSGPVRIVIGLDGTRAALDVVRAVAGRMWPNGGEARLVTAKQTAGGASDSTEAWIGNFVSEAREILESAGLRVSQILKEANPKAVIIDSADEWAADCIFIGASTEGTSPDSHLLGSVATAVVSRANCTVEVVRRARSGSAS